MRSKWSRDFSALRCAIPKSRAWCIEGIDVLDVGAMDFGSAWVSSFQKKWKEKMDRFDRSSQMVLSRGR